MKNILALLVLSAFAAFGQLSTTNTTLSTALAANTTTQWCIASATGVVLPTLGANGSYLFVDREAARIMSQGSSSTCYNVQRGVLGTSANASHAAASKVWVGAPAVSSGDSSRPFTPGVFISSLPTGSCVAANQYTLPLIYTGPAGGGAFTGSVVDCVGGRWGAEEVGEFYVGPTNCSFTPTTLTTTNTYVPVGASAVFVLNATSNAAAGTNTLTCNILPPTSIRALQGAVITDIVVPFGSQTTAPTSLGTVTLGYIQLPTPATSETESTVTPVASFGGTVTTTAPTALTTVTTAGAFLTIKSALGTPLPLSQDLRFLVLKVPFVQSAAAAMTINTPGLIVHYSKAIDLP